MERLQQDLRVTRAELAAAEYSVSEWERKFAEFASSVLRSSEAAENAARGMYEAMWNQDREQLIAHFQGFLTLYSLSLSDFANQSTLPKSREI